MFSFFKTLDILDSAWIRWINRGDRSTSYIELFDGTKLSLTPQSFPISPLLDSSGLSNETQQHLNDFSVLHTSVPNIKLYYPEPFIASPNFVHEDIWFLHIVIYQYWLWFFFIYLIIFFFLAFLITIRWCNIRHRPVRETRGVSRSKCGDLITATVPVSWAASIIIHESTDAIELTDGFGSTEMAVGIRAYQWGWEYYYPKDLDLSMKSGNSTLRLGSSLMYRREAGSAQSLRSFKNFSLYSDFLDIPKSPASLLLGYYNAATVTRDLSLGSNRLISRNASPLLTSPRLLQINNLLTNHSISSQSNLLNIFINYAYDDVFSSKPTFSNLQQNQLSPLALFRNSVGVLNSRDVEQLLQLSCFGGHGRISLGTYSWLCWDNARAVNNGYALMRKLYTPHIMQCADDVVHTPALKLLIQASLSLASNCSSWPFFSLIADQDFKRWATHELIEELFWAASGDSPLRSVSADTPKSVSLRDFSYEPTLRDNFYYNPFSVINIFKNSLNETPLLHRDFVNTLWSNDSLHSSFWSFKLPAAFSVLSAEGPVLHHFLFNFRPITQFEFLRSYSLSLFVPSTFTGLAHNELFSAPKLISFFAHRCTQSSSARVLIDTVNDFSATGKSFNMFNQAFWKVFKSTIDEERTGFNYYSFSRTSAELPLINQHAKLLLGFIQKFGNDFFEPLAYKLLSTDHLDIPSHDKLWETFTLAFPFSLSFESDITRYIWFDWYSTRNTIITKAIDTSVFSLYGAKQYNYTFTKDPKVTLLNKTDNFFVKYAHARKLFVPSYIYTPFFYSKFRDWSLNTSLAALFNSSTSSSISEYSNLLVYSETQSSLFSSQSRHIPFTANYSNTSSVTRAYFTTASAISNQIDSLALLFDVLAKRDYVIRYLGSVYSITSLICNPTYQASFLNPIVLQLKLASNHSVQSFYPTLLSSTRRYFYEDYEGFSSYKNNVIQERDTSTLRSPYQPMRKGIVNMIRIQADKAVAMPTDTRLQILAVSKDIIHSWSIPSAGIKIDCIPGYSSHRVALFTLSGIYWGQCMEICGRFHHWMPIVVYFIRRDLFCVWCVHFVFKNRQFNSLLQSADSAYFDSTPSISMDWSSWSYEL